MAKFNGQYDPVFNFRLDPETRTKLEAVARGSDRTLSDVARAALAQYLESHQQKNPAA